MALSLAQKLRIKAGMNILAIHAPANFAGQLEPLPRSVSIFSAGKTYDQIHWFVKNKSAMDRDLPRILSLLKPDAICWIYFPKSSSSIQTDLSRDKGWEKLEKVKGLQWLSLISFDETWSSFGIRLHAEPIKKLVAGAVEREIFRYVDPASRSVRLPQDLAALLTKNKKAHRFFESLSFTNKKEYIEWVVTAKKEETRRQRIGETLSRLDKEWKNPRNS